LVLALAWPGWLPPKINPSRILRACIYTADGDGSSSTDGAARRGVGSPSPWAGGR
jgi:hypothetical protein